MYPDRSGSASAQTPVSASPAFASLDHARNFMRMNMHDISEGAQ
jgi:hypothetical protein